jgi:hypothetical protein
MIESISDRLLHYRNILHELIPIDVIKTQSPSEWKKVRNERILYSSFRPNLILNTFQAIIAAYNQDNGLNSENAKISFLKYVYKWPTFGSAFFEVKVKLGIHHFGPLCDNSESYSKMETPITRNTC